MYPDELLQKSSQWMQENVKAIIHLGANSSTTTTDVKDVMTNNVMQTIQLATKFAPATRVVYASSASVYGHHGGYGQEDDYERKDRPSDIRPICLYAQSKAWIDQALVNHDNVFGLRYFNVYGPREKHKGSQASVIPSFRDQIRSRKHIVKLFDWRHRYSLTPFERDWVYVDDVVEITRRIALNDRFEQNQNRNRIYNVGTGFAHSYEEIVDHIGDILKIKPKVKYIKMPEELKKQYQIKTRADISKLLEAIGGYQFANIKDGINKYFESDV